MNDDAFADLLVAELPRLRAKAWGMVRTGPDAEDLAQSAALAAWAGRAWFEAGTDFPAWAFEVMRNCRRDAHRKAVRRVVTEGADVSDLPDRFLAAPPAQEWAQRLREAAEAVPRLDPAYHATLALSALGYGPVEVSGWLGVPSGTVKSRVSRARTQLESHRP